MNASRAATKSKGCLMASASRIICVRSDFCFNTMKVNLIILGDIVNKHYNHMQEKVQEINTIADDFYSLHPKGNQI